MRMIKNITKNMPTMNMYISCSKNCKCIKNLQENNSYINRYFYKKCYSDKYKYTNSFTNDYLRRLIREKKI